VGELGFVGVFELVHVSELAGSQLAPSDALELLVLELLVPDVPLGGDDTHLLTYESSLSGSRTSWQVRPA
jgi:hypothetical protein